MHRLHASGTRSRHVSRFESRHDRKDGAGLPGKPITEALMAILDSSVSKPLPDRTVADLIAVGLVAQALKGNIQAIKEILDRTEGTVPLARREEPVDRKVRVIITNVGSTQSIAEPSPVHTESSRKLG